MKEIVSLVRSTYRTNLIIFGSVTLIAVVVICIPIALPNVTRGSIALATITSIFALATLLWGCLKYIALPFKTKLDDALAQVVTAQDSAQSKMDFLSQMSHEIRTPVGAMMGFGQLLNSAKLTADERTYVDSINMSGDFLLRILNDILDLSKIEADGIQLEESPFRLSRLTQNISLMMDSEAVAKNVQFNVDCHGLKGHSLIGDQHRIKQVLMNLIGNAIKFADKGDVTLRVIANTYTTPNESNKRATVTFEVEDTGIGMSPGQLEKIFEPFSQADAAVSREFGGTGLGLSISHKLVTTMGGKLQAVSTKGVGSTFSFELDLAFSNEVEKIEVKEAPNSVCPPSSKNENLRILVAEDEALNRTLISKFFKVLGYPVDFAIDGQDCENRLSGNEKFDAIFLDQHMPHNSGMNIAKKIRDGHFGKDIAETKLILMSADVLANEQSKAMGINDFVSKPIDMGALKKCLDSIKIKKPELRSLKALIVEDEPLNRQMIGQIFSSFGMTPQFANDGVECIEFLESHPYLDLIMLDLRMPRMDGWTVARKIRNGEAGKDFCHIPIAVVSAEIQSEATCRELGVNEFISKPFQVAQIRDFVQKVGANSGVVLSR